MKPLHNDGMADREVSQRRADQIIEWLRHYGEERIDSRLFDERRCVPPYVILDFGNRGVLGMQVPERFGGLGLWNRDFLRVIEQLAAIDLSLASLVFIHNANGVRPIVGYATPAVRDALLPILASGRELSAFALTEPAAGSNLPGIATVALPTPAGGWRIRGVKRWNGSGWAGIVSVFARTLDEKGKLGHASGFVVRQGMPGLRVGPESLTMGVRSIMQNALILDDVEVPPTHLLGEVGKGMEVADEALLIARLCMGAISIGGMKRCAQLMLRYASNRVVSTGRLLDSPIALAMLGDLTIKITLVEVLVDCLTRILDRGEYPAEEACMAAKIVASDYLWQAADNLVEILGGRGYMENNIASQLLRDCRMLRIGEGANELMTLSVGRRLLHSEKLHHLLGSELGLPRLSDRLKEASHAILNRCISGSSPFADRSAAVAWGHTLCGQVAIQGVLLAAVEAAARATPLPRLRQARDWASVQFEATLARALDSSTAEQFLPTTRQASDLIASYRETIGDIEQAPPGIEEAVDPLLRRDPTGGGFPKFAHLPGNALVEAPTPESRQPAERAPSALSPDERRRLAADLLKKRLTSGPSPVGTTKAPGS